MSPRARRTQRNKKILEMELVQGAWLQMPWIQARKQAAGEMMDVPLCPKHDRVGMQHGRCRDCGGPSYICWPNLTFMQMKHRYCPQCDHRPEEELFCTRCRTINVMRHNVPWSPIIDGQDIKCRICKYPIAEVEKFPSAMQ